MTEFSIFFVSLQLYPVQKPIVFSGRILSMYFLRVKIHFGVIKAARDINVCGSLPAGSRRQIVTTASGNGSFAPEVSQFMNFKIIQKSFALDIYFNELNDV